MASLYRVQLSQISYKIKKQCVELFAKMQGCNIIFMLVASLNTVAVKIRGRCIHALAFYYKPASNFDADFNAHVIFAVPISWRRIPAPESGGGQPPTRSQRRRL
jgi:hypothetical protein